MSYMRVECPECGASSMIYPREERTYKSGDTIGYNGCFSCGERIEATVVIRKEDKEE